MPKAAYSILTRFIVGTPYKLQNWYICNLVFNNKSQISLLARAISISWSPMAVHHGHVGLILRALLVVSGKWLAGKRETQQLNMRELYIPHGCLKSPASLSCQNPLYRGNQDVVGTLTLQVKRLHAE